MRNVTLLAFKWTVGALAAAVAVLAASDARSDGPRLVTPSGPGFQGVYGQLPADQVEFLSTGDSIKSAAANGAPSLVWEVLEHGEKVECLDCIAAVEPLMYDGNATTREIAAWWLRRRIFGVFGKGEVYERTVQTLQSDPSPRKRAYAAYALGELFAPPGVDACAQAVVSDADPSVRAAAASALGRLNSDGSGALGQALSDADPSVRLAALRAATRINAFSGVAGIAALTADASVEVRRAAIEALDTLRQTDAVSVVAAAARSDSDPAVRAEACHALGTFGDKTVLALLMQIAANDSDGFVRDQAQIALQRL